MERDGWQRVEALVDEALEMPEAERAAFARAVASRDPELGRALSDFLASADAARDFLDEPLEMKAGALLAALGEDEDHAVGRLIGPYRVLGELGRGGMGAVFLAERADGSFEQRVALKLVKSGFDTREILDRFRSERQILARLQHPHIARLLDGGAGAEGQPYFAMEHVEGEPIGSYCDAARLDLAARVRLFLQVVDAVEYAHRNLVVHRDLKPSNILVTPDGQAKLLDFGIAKVFDPQRDRGDETATRGALPPMTPQYAAPEQIRGEPVTTATDVYSLGLVLYQLLCGRYPYRLHRLAPGEIERVVCGPEPPPPSAAVRAREDDDGPSPAEVAAARASTIDRLSRDLRGDLDNVAAMALRKEPERRYASARALGEDLRRFLGGLPVAARADTWRYRASKFVGRHRLGVLAAALVVTSILGGVVGTLWQARAALRQAQRAEEVKRFALGLFSVSDPDAAKGRDVTARELLDRSAERIRAELADDPEVAAEMLLVVGDIYHRLGRDEEGGPLIKEGLRLRRERFGADDARTAEAELVLGSWHFSRGEMTRAAELYEHALRTREARLGPDHPETAVARGRLGRVRFEQGDLAAAETMLRAAMAALRGRGPGTDADLATHLSTLGRVLQSRGDLDGAQAHHREALAIRQKLFGGEHTRVHESLLNLAAVMKETGDLAGAEAGYREVLALSRRLAGSDHETVANGLNNLASVLVIRGDYAEAESLLRESVGMRRRLHGPDNPRQAASLHNLARTLRWQGRLAEAEDLSRRALELAVAMLGDEHVNVAAAREERAHILAGLGRLGPAEEMARRALSTIQRTQAAGHPRLADAQLTLGHVLVMAGRPAEAEPLLGESLSRRRDRFGQDDWRTAEAALELAECLSALGRRREAAALLSDAGSTLERTLGAAHALTGRARSALERAAPARER